MNVFLRASWAEMAAAQACAGSLMAVKKTQLYTVRMRLLTLLV